MTSPFNVNKNNRVSISGKKGNSDIEVLNYNSFHLSTGDHQLHHQQQTSPEITSSFTSNRQTSVTIPLTSSIASDSHHPHHRHPHLRQVNGQGDTHHHHQNLTYGTTSGPVTSGSKMKRISTANSSSSPSSSPSSTSNNSINEHEQPAPLNSSSNNCNINSDSKLYYNLNDTPGLWISILLGLQHYITMLGGTITYPYILTSKLCMKESDPARGYVIATTLFCSGFASLIQTYFGVRLPIIQGATFTFLVPTLAILALPVWQCPTDFQIMAARGANSTFTSLRTVAPEEYAEVWTSRMREIQGAIIISSIFEVVIGITGILGYLLKFITPLSIVPTISLIGLSLFKEATAPAGESWIVAAITVLLVVLFSQYLTHYKVPLMLYSSQHKKFYVKRVKIFELFPILLTITIAWIICWILTLSNAYPKNHPARTDGIMNRLVSESPWIRIPYPFQWGIPTVTLSAVLGMTAGVVASAIESIGDYYAAARLCDVPLPPSHAINRGIFMEGVGCIFSGIMGSGGGLTSYSENIGAIGITRIASRRVVATASCLMIAMSIFTKFSAIFATIPIPIIGGLLMTMFSICTAVGLSSLQFIDLNSPRNMFVLGSSLFFGLSIPKWILDHPESIRTGSPAVDQIIYVLMSTSMFVGGFIAILLDNTIPGSDEERGVNKWLTTQKKPHQGNNQQGNSGHGDDEHFDGATSDPNYQLPGKLNEIIKRISWLKYFPISPTYTEENLKDKVAQMTHKLTTTMVISESSEKKNVDTANNLDGHLDNEPTGVTVTKSTAVTNVKNTINESNILPRKGQLASTVDHHQNSPDDRTASGGESPPNNKFMSSVGGFFLSKDKKKVTQSNSNDSVKLQNRTASNK